MNVSRPDCIRQRERRRAAKRRSDAGRGSAAKGKRVEFNQRETKIVRLAAGYGCCNLQEPRGEQCSPLRGRQARNEVKEIKEWGVGKTACAGHGAYSQVRLCHRSSFSVSLALGLVSSHSDEKQKQWRPSSFSALKLTILPASSPLIACPFPRQYPAPRRFNFRLAVGSRA